MQITKWLKNNWATLSLPRKFSAAVATAVVLTFAIPLALILLGSILPKAYNTANPSSHPDIEQRYDDAKKRIQDE